MDATSERLNGADPYPAEGGTLQRDAVLTFTLDDGLYEAPLLQDVRLDHGAHTIVGRWARFGLEAEGDTEADVFRDLLSMLLQHVGDDPTAPRFQPLAALTRELGRRLPAEELSRGEDAWVREVILPFTTGVDRHYRVPLLQEATVDRRDGEITLHAFDISCSAADSAAAVHALKRAIGDACGTSEAPGPRFAEISAWVHANGRREAAADLAQVDRTRADHAAAHDELPDVEPADIERHEPTDLPMLVQFWGARCAWCHVQAPVLAQLADDLSGRVVVGKLDADRHDGIAKRFGVSSVPTVLLLHGGRELHRIVGHRGAKTIARELEPHLRCNDI